MNQSGPLVQEKQQPQNRHRKFMNLSVQLLLKNLETKLQRKFQFFMAEAANPAMQKNFLPIKMWMAA